MAKRKEYGDRISRILERLDVQREYESWGFKPSAEANGNGWMDGYAIGRDENNPSAGICVSGANKGAYKDHAEQNGESSLPFFKAAVKFGGHSSTSGAINFYAVQTGVEEPEPQEEADDLKPTSWLSFSAMRWCAARPGVTEASMIRFGATRCFWKKHRVNGAEQLVYAFPIMTAGGDVGGHVLMSTSTKYNIAITKKVANTKRYEIAEYRSKHVTKGAKKGWLNIDAVERLLAPDSKVEVVWKVEGITDAFALDGIIPDELRGTHVVVTNACGSNESPDKKMCEFLRGKTVYILHDADKPGENGAMKWAATLRAMNDVKHRHVRLPYVIADTHGKDARDWIAEGKTYDDFIMLAAATNEVAGEEAMGDDLPEIVTNNRQLDDNLKSAADALRKSNDPPTIFLRVGMMVQISRDDPKRLDLMDRDRTRAQLARAARWIKETNSENVNVYPPEDIVKTIGASRHIDLPEITGIAPAPMYDETGSLNTKPGYSTGTKHYHDFEERELSPPEEPSVEEVASARSLILDDLLGDFPFKDEGSKANAVEFMIRPFVRQLIGNDNMTPMALINAPTEGTGKTLLANVLCTPFCGSSVGSSGVPSDDDEMNKQITAMLSSGKPMFLLDNLPDRRMIDSKPLAQLLTITPWTGRLLGSTKMLTFPSTAMWVATGNNPRLSPELCRRVTSIRLVAKTANPSQRTGFKHGDLVRWTKENRWRLVEAVLTLVNAWKAAGRPSGTEVLGGFGPWASVMGGILGVAGVPGMLSNRNDFMSLSNIARCDWEDFIESWYDAYGVGTVQISQLVSVASDNGLLLSVLGDGGDRSQQTRMGNAIQEKAEHTFESGWSIVKEKRGKSKPAMYRLEKQGRVIMEG